MTTCINKRQASCNLKLFNQSLSENIYPVADVFLVEIAMVVLCLTLNGLRVNGLVEEITVPLPRFAHVNVAGSWSGRFRFVG
jgi:hypothetical protein